VLTCFTNRMNLSGLVTRVYQCNGVGYGGGNVLRCSVKITNQFQGVKPKTPTAATVNQCNGSAPVTTGCRPFPATTTGAVITQCNKSSYGGGQEDFNCRASGTSTASLRVTVNQCNDSNYGGGSWLNCTASVTTQVLAAVSRPVATVAPTAHAPGGPAATPGLRDTNTDATPPSAGSTTPNLGAIWALAFGAGLLAMWAAVRRRADANERLDRQRIRVERTNPTQMDR
jgi:hypothetical protein